MTLKTSSRKINPFWNMLLFTTRKNLGIIVVLCIASLLYYPGSFVVNYKNLLVTAQNYSTSYVLKEFGVAITIISSIVAVLFNMLNFSFLYKKSSSDVFHAFPLTRSELLLSRLVSGLVSTLIPTVLCYVSFGILMLFNSWMGNFAQLFYYLLHTLLIILVCSSFSMIFVVSAGSDFDLAVSLFGGNLALLAIGWIFESILDETLVGFDSSNVSEIIYNISPPYFCGVGLQLAHEVKDRGIDGQSITFLIRSIVYIAVFTGISLLLYNRRKAEKGGTAYAYKFMYWGCSLLAGICGGYLLGIIFIGEVKPLGFWIFAIIGCLLTTVIYGTITNRGFKGVKKSLLMGGISAIVLIAVAVSGITGGFGYTKRIPKAQKIKSVSVIAFDENITFTNPQMALDLHEAIINNDAFLIDYEYTSEYKAVENVEFNYTLENGKTVTREFIVNVEAVDDELLAIYQSDERLYAINKSIDLNVQELRLYFHYDNESYDIIVSSNEVNALLDAYWKDIQNCNTSVFQDSECDIIEISGYSRIDDYKDDYFYFQLSKHLSFENTQQFLKDIFQTKIQTIS